MPTPRRPVRDAILMLIVAGLLLVLAEGVTRIALRLRTGQWPRTLAVAWDEARRDTATLYRRHPYLLVGPHEGARDPRAGRIVIDSLGYRSAERPREKAAGVRRVICVGGSTTYDTLAAGNEKTWPARLEATLRARGLEVEVWNAGFPSWTTLENLIALAIRDVDLAPDLIVLYQGINDLQPLAQEPVDPQYEGLHVERVLTGLGIERTPPPWHQRLVLLERLRSVIYGPPRLDVVPAPPATQRTTLSPEALRVFARNLRSLVAVARQHGANVLLVTQTLRIREQHFEQDKDVFTYWLPDLEPRAAVGALERLNDVLRRLAAEDGVPLADAARNVAWTDADFGDPMHTTGQGSQKLADFLAEPVRAALDAPAPR